VFVLDLAQRMVQLSGLSVRDKDHPGGDIEIVITGLRPGEKLFEELLIGNKPERTAHPRIMKAHEPFVPWAQLAQELKLLEAAAASGDLVAIKAFLQQHVHGYQPGDTP
jgi:FlaA1/EpsC-like NDP-sugar epimerase